MRGSITARGVAGRGVGGARNWDYRFTWIRDSAFMLRSLYELGFGWEAIEYLGFIIDAVSGGDRTGPFELQIMYGIGGERELTERTLDHLSGWRGARPVRVGNAAWNQRQHDVWGMILDAVDVQFRRNASQIEMQWQAGAEEIRAEVLEKGVSERGVFPASITRPTIWTPRCCCFCSWGSCLPATSG